MGRPKRTSASVALDRQVAAAALQKQRAGKQPTVRELAALRRVEAEREEILRQEYYRTIPAKHYRALSGRSDQVRNEQAKRYKLPIGGPVINLAKLLPALHDFLAKHAKKLKASDDGDLLLTGVVSPQLERYRGYKADLAKLDVEERAGNLLRRESVHHTYTQIASRLREVGARLQRECGRDAFNILDDALIDLERIIESESDPAN